MGRNSFVDLEKLHEERYRKKTRETKKKVDSSIDIFHFIGEIFELFIPKVFQVFVKASGGDDIKYPEGPGSPNRKPDGSEPKYPDLK